MTVSEWLRARPWWFWTVGGVVVVLGAFGAGRLLAPTKTITKVETKWETKVETKEVVREVKVEGPVQIVTRYRPVPEVPPPPGCPECEPIIEVIETRGPTTTTTDTGRETNVAASGSEAVTQIVQRDAPRVAVFGTVGLPFSALGVQPPAYGVTVTARVLGPLTVLAGGEGGPGGGSARVGLGLTF